QSKQYARNERAALHHGKCKSEKTGSQEAVLSVTKIDEYGWEGEGEEEPETILRCPHKNCTHRPQIKGKRRAQPRGERERVGHPCQQIGNEQEQRRILEGIELGGGAEDCLLARKMRRMIESRRRSTVVRQGSCRIEAGKIRAKRAVKTVVESVRCYGQIRGPENCRRQQRQSDPPHPFAGKPCTS